MRGMRDGVRCEQQELWQGAADVLRPKVQAGCGQSTPLPATESAKDGNGVAANMRNVWQQVRSSLFAPGGTYLFGQVQRGADERGETKKSCRELRCCIAERMRRLRDDVYGRQVCCQDRAKDSEVLLCEVFTQGGATSVLSTHESQRRYALGSRCVASRQGESHRTRRWQMSSLWDGRQACASSLSSNGC